MFRSVSKDPLAKPEIQLDQDPKEEEMPSPQLLPNSSTSSADRGVVNGGEPSVFVEPVAHAGARQNIPEHIKPDELPNDELRTLVRQQLEYYFSRFVLLCNKLMLVHFMFSNNSRSIHLMYNDCVHLRMNSYRQNIVYFYEKLSNENI